MKKILFSLVFALPFTLLYPQQFLTVAEKSDFKATSTHREVLDFCQALLKYSPWIRMEEMAVTAEGRSVPLLVIGKPLPAKPSDLAGDKRAVLYIQANIHAGEVEGKEASLMFVRDLLSDRNPDILKDLVILVCPDFNPDGNDQISPKNRTHQNGPENGVGVRHNGMMLDLNRDGMKAEAPEVRGLYASVFNKWDPDIFVDCHTTNGSYHVEPVTFTWMVNPNGEKSLIDYMAGKMCPAVKTTLLKKYNVENCFYGEFANMTQPEKGWFFDASEPRYLVNYYGLRNRLAILNENYVYADYKSRVLGNYYLLKSIAEYAALNRSEIKTLIAAADAKTVERGKRPSVSDSVAVEYKARPLSEPVTIKTYKAELATDANGRRSYRKTDERQDVTVPYYVDYYPVKQVKFPFAYALTVSDPEVIQLLKNHGIEIEKLVSEKEVSGERFIISELKPSPRLNQGHYTNSIKGSYKTETAVLRPGTIIVRCSQPLANVVTTLLEPLSNDGLIYWNFLDRYLAPQWGMGYNQLPVIRLLEPVDLGTEKF